MQELWQPVKGYEGLYEVSDHGRVKSLERWISPGRGYRLNPERIMKPSDIRGYLCVCTSGKLQKIHRLVMLAFCGPEPEWSTMVNHIDKDTRNNRLGNLEWSNNGHNKRHANRKHHYKGNLYSAIELAEIAKTDVYLVSRRLRSGWSVTDAVERPRRRTARGLKLL